MKVSRSLLAGLFGLVAVGASAQVIRPGMAPGFRPGFKFLAPAGSGNCILATPATILSGQLVEWWDLTDQTTMTFGTSPAVASVKGKISNTVASQTTAANQPTYSAAARNGTPGLSFNGSQYFGYTPTGFPSGAIASVFFIGGYNNTPSSSTGGVFGYGQGSTASWRYVSVNGSRNIAVGLFGSDQTTTLSWAAIDRLVTWSLNGTASAVAVDGGTPAAATLSTPNTSLSTGAIGRFNGGGNQAFTGVLQQIVVASGAVTAAQMQKMQGWESWADGKAGTNLPAGHPFISRAPCTSD